MTEAQAWRMAAEALEGMVCRTPASECTRTHSEEKNAAYRGAAEQFRQWAEDAEAGAARHPGQPVVVDESGVARFKENVIVRFLVDSSRERGCGLNELALMPFSDEDRSQLAQLIGYSVSGFGDLSYADPAAVAAADAEAARALGGAPAADPRADEPAAGAPEPAAAEVERAMRAVRRGDDLRPEVCALAAEVGRLRAAAPGPCARCGFPFSDHGRGDGCSRACAHCGGYVDPASAPAPRESGEWESIADRLNERWIAANRRTEQAEAENARLREVLEAVDTDDPVVLRAAMTRAGVGASISVNDPLARRRVARAALAAAPPAPPEPGCRGTPGRAHTWSSWRPYDPTLVEWGRTGGFGYWRDCQILGCGMVEKVEDLKGAGRSLVEPEPAAGRDGGA